MKKLFTLLFISFTIFSWSQSEILTGDITTNKLLTSNNSYLLKGFVYVKNGAVLTIEPGTIIKADKAEKSISISEAYYAQLLKNKQEFDNRLFEELEVLSKSLSKMYSK